ncbi:DUF2997 domain-containing protein [Nostoc sp. ChiQUE01b]|uniref:DUF2997 domain-containing protein n=1 Tax=Nostoc sp. ChiQUE01b TaxID=3075376 RepID=UPI002AD20F71|nr:DUF2997 domain-containing protein [Nostoc sp. ChiQUE01b]MDZ8264520.1 DUF2997 domain-containing protein [Nostoc sp. ChiQUE01b]
MSSLTIFIIFLVKWYEGFEGLSCLSATQPFEEALGVVEGDRIYKDEAQTQQLRTTNSNQTRLRQ